MKKDHRTIIKKIRRKLLLFAPLVFLIVFIFTANHGLAVNFEASVKIPGFEDGNIGGMGIANYINAIYKYSVGIGAILATVILMFGGIRWITAGGNASSIDSAKAWIFAALSGLLLLLFTYSILYIINPQLVEFQSISLPKPDNEEYAAPDTTQGCCLVTISGGTRRALNVTQSVCTEYGNDGNFAAGKVSNETNDGCATPCPGECNNDYIGGCPNSATKGEGYCAIGICCIHVTTGYEELDEID